MEIESEADVIHELIGFFAGVVFVFVISVELDVFFVESAQLSDRKELKLKPKCRIEVSFSCSVGTA
jgi:hypothetical protein